jgi:hypothetical protein
MIGTQKCVVWQQQQQEHSFATLLFSELLCVSRQSQFDSHSFSTIYILPCVIYYRKVSI